MKSTSALAPLAVDEPGSNWRLADSTDAGISRAHAGNAPGQRYRGCWHATKGRMISYVRGQLRIEDRERLESASCECYATLTRQLKAWKSESE